METDSPRQKTTSVVVSALALIFILIVFAPSLIWLAEVAIARDQVRDAAIVLIFGLVFLIRDRAVPARTHWEFGSRSATFAAGACLTAAAAGFLQMPLLMIMALGLLAGSLLLFVFGDELSGPAIGLAAAFAGFAILAVFFPLADWPLRIFAGKSVTGLLDFLGLPAQLGLAGDPPKLILISEGRPFEVAPECNGFGITGSSLLLALLLAFSRDLAWLDKILIVLLAPLIGLFSNALRILLIVLLAPLVGSRGYHVMHEAVGITLFLLTLVLIWWLIAGLPDRRRKIPLK